MTDNQDQFRNRRLGFIGVGAIAEATIVGLIQSGCNSPVRLSRRNEQRSQALAERFANVTVDSENQSIVDHSDWIFIAVLPQQARAVLRTIQFRPEHRLISLVAGIEIAELQTLAAPVGAIHRMIPLPPIERGVGPLPVCPPCSDLGALFANCANVIGIENESLFSVFSAASGLMATHHLFVWKVAEWMSAQGVNREDATAYASHMFAALAEIECHTPADELAGLADACTTVGGLNEQALQELRELGWFEEPQTRLTRLFNRLENGL
ncbi:MAG: NAD(P)-binding domain-containing protein [Pirellulaceae bacterium]|nr:NAD(P)-binding domain-containing protein [Pirellulaceae bacterium]